MACVVELSGVGSNYADDLNDPSVHEKAHSVQVSSLDIETGIQTFDASDVDQHLEKSKSQRLFGKCVIILASYNPLPLLRLALVRAHTSDTEKPSSSPYRKRLTAVDITHFKDDALWGMESQGVGSAQVPRRELIVINLSTSIQRDFRQRVLLALLLYVGVVTAVVSASLLCIPWASVQSLMDQSPYLLPVAQAGITAVAILSLWLVYALRFDSPVNLAALGFLTVGEMACAVAYGVTHGPHGVVQSLSLLLCGVMLLRAFAGRTASSDYVELLCPAQAAVRSAAILALVSLPLNAVLGETATHFTTSALLGLLGFTSLALLWVSLVLTVLTQTMTPEEYASALVFFQADLIVLAIVEPINVVFKYLRLYRRWFQQLRRNKEDAIGPNSAKPQHNVVVPAFWPDRKETETSGTAAAATTRTSPHETPLYPAHLIPRRSRAGQQDDETPVVAASLAPLPSNLETSLNQSVPGARRRNSTADE